MYMRDVTGNFVVDLCRIINVSSLNEDSRLNHILREPGADTKYVKATQYFNQLNNIIGKETSIECSIGNIEICGSNKDVKCRAEAILDSTVEEVIGNEVYDNDEYRGKTISDILADVGVEVHIETSNEVIINNIKQGSKIKYRGIIDVDRGDNVNTPIMNIIAMGKKVKIVIR